MHEQSTALVPNELSREESYLFKSEQINEAQSSLLIPVKQSASPHQRRDAVKQNRSSIDAQRIIACG